jgi:exosome complex component RRP42
MEDYYWILEKDKIQALLAEGKRPDGRKFDEYRKVELKREFSKNADGSTRLKLGNTEVACGIKFDVGTPYPDSPDKGGMSTGVELSVGASPEFETGPPRENAIELGRVVDRAIRESGAFDFKGMCIEEGEKAYFAFIDCYVINYDGNVFDACSLAALAALMEAKMPKYEDDKIIRKEYSGKLKLLKKPLLTTFAKIQNSVVLDPGLEEDMSLDARFSLGTTEDDTICAFQKGGVGSFTEKEVIDSIDIALKEAKKLRKLL